MSVFSCNNYSFNICYQTSVFSKFLPEFLLRSSTDRKVVCLSFRATYNLPHLFFREREQNIIRVSLLYKIVSLKVAYEADKKHNKINSKSHSSYLTFMYFIQIRYNLLTYSEVIFQRQTFRQMMTLESRLAMQFTSYFSSCTIPLISITKRHQFSPLECPAKSNWTNKDGLPKSFLFLMLLFSQTQR